MEVTDPADIANIEQILNVFADERARVTYCVFEINGVVRVVKNAGGGDDHAEVEVIEILKDNMGGITERGEEITLYMNYSPCTVDGRGAKHNCAEEIRKLKRWNPSLQLTICYAYPYYDNIPENREVREELIRTGVANEIMDDDREELDNLLRGWYAALNEQNENAEEPQQRD